MDYDNDGKKDLIAGDTRGQVWMFRNSGTKQQPRLDAGARVEAAGKPIQAATTTYKTVDGKRVKEVVPASHELALTYSKLHMADWNGDGLPDLLIGHSTTVVLYRNVGTLAAPRFAEPTLIKIPEGKFPSRPSPYVIDWDNDGKRDLLVGCERPTVYFYRNVGTNARPQLARGELLKLKAPEAFEKSYRCRFDVTDWNNDGKRDLLIGTRVNLKKATHTGGNLWLFLGK